MATWAFLNAISPLASCSSARWFSSFFDQRMRIPRLRFSHEWQASTTHRRGFHLGIADLPGGVFTAGADVRREPLRDHRRARRVVVVAAVKAQTLRVLIGGDRTCDRGGGDRVVQQLHVMAVRTLVREPDRDPCGVQVRTERLAPFWLFP